MNNMLIVHYCYWTEKYTTAVSTGWKPHNEYCYLNTCKVDKITEYYTLLLMNKREKYVNTRSLTIHVNIIFPLFKYLWGGRKQVQAYHSSTMLKDVLLIHSSNIEGFTASYI